MCGFVKRESPQTRPCAESWVVVRGLEREVSFFREDGRCLGRISILRLLRTLWIIVSATRAGDEGWSVITTLRAPEKAAMMDGSAVPIQP